MDLKNLKDLSLRVFEARGQHVDLLIAQKEVNKAIRALSERKDVFLPHDHDYEMIAIDVKGPTVLYHHRAFPFNDKFKPKYASGKRLSLELDLRETAKHRYRLSSFYPSSKPNEFNGIPNSGHHIYAGDITSREDHDRILQGAIKFKLEDGDVVICTSDEDRKKVLDAYLSLDVPKEYKQEIIFKDRMQYPVETFPHFRWHYSRQQQKKDWESPCTRKANSYLMGCRDPRHFSPWETHIVLPIDEFIKRLKNHERGD